MNEKLLNNILGSVKKLTPVELEVLLGAAARMRDQAAGPLLPNPLLHSTPPPPEMPAPLPGAQSLLNPGE